MTAHNDNIISGTSGAIMAMITSAITFDSTIAVVFFSFLGGFVGLLGKEFFYIIKKYIIRRYGKK